MSTMESDDHLLATLSAAAASRLSNQIARAFRGTYGAKTGLRMLVRSTAQQLLVAGASEAAVGRTFERCVLSHPACPPAGSGASVNGATDSDALVALTQKCIAEIVLETKGSASVRAAKRPA